VLAADFYFAFADLPDDLGQRCVVVTPAELWEAEGRWSDQSEADEFLSPLFGRLMESVFEFDCEEHEARRILISIGMVENEEIAKDA